MLQRDGRTTVQALSEAIHLSARATLNRVRKLESEGLIEGYRASVSRAALGEQICGVRRDRAEGPAPGRRAALREAMAATPEVVACYVISGRYDYLVRIACPHLADYHEADQRVDGRRGSRHRKNRHQHRVADHQGIHRLSGAQGGLSGRCPTPLPFRKCCAPIHAVAAAPRCAIHAGGTLMSTRLSSSHEDSDMDANNDSVTQDLIGKEARWGAPQLRTGCRSSSTTRATAWSGTSRAAPTST
jgi:DNA-binding Lrp family transcriptional regulator